MDEIIDAIAFQYANDYSNNSVEKDAIYTLLISKLHKTKDKWKKLSSLSAYLKVVAYKEIIDYKANPILLAGDVELNVLVDKAEIATETDVTSKHSYDVMVNELRNNTTHDEYEVICRTFGIDGFDRNTKNEIYDITFYTVAEQRGILQSVFRRLRTNKIIFELYKSLG